MNRPDISRLNKNRSIYLKLGFICSLSFMFFAFNWTSDFYVPDNKQIVVNDDPIVQVIRTIHKEKRLPPPPVVNITPDPIIKDFEITNEFIPEKIEKAITDVKELIPEDPVPAPIAVPAPAPMPLPVEKNVPEELFEVVEEMPRFPGCEEEVSKKERRACAERTMLEFIYRQVKYPELARRNQIEGMSVVSFIIEKDGSISGLEIARDPGGGLGKESLRVASSMPYWIPGKQRGVPVRVKYNLPIKYKLD